MSPFFFFFFWAFFPSIPSACVHLTILTPNRTSSPLAGEEFFCIKTGRKHRCLNHFAQRPGLRDIANSNMLMARFDEANLQQGVPITMVNAIRTALTGSPLDIPCPNCHAHNCYTIDEYLLSSPRILLVQLNRVALDGHKIKEPIAIEETLTLPHELFKRGPTSGNEPLGDEFLPLVYESAEAPQGLPTNYALYAVVHHIGDTPQGGHYYAHVKKDGRWRVIDDNVVRFRSFEAVNSDVNRRSAYVFAYRRMDLEDQFHEDIFREDGQEELVDGEEVLLEDDNTGLDEEEIAEDDDLGGLDNEDIVDDALEAAVQQLGGLDDEGIVDDAIEALAAVQQEFDDMIAAGIIADELQQGQLEFLQPMDEPIPADIGELQGGPQEYPQPMDEPPPGFYEDLERALGQQARNNLTAASLEELQGETEQQAKFRRLRTTTNSDYDEFDEESQEDQPMEEPQNEPQEQEQEEQAQNPLQIQPAPDHQLQRVQIGFQCQQLDVEITLDETITLSQESLQQTATGPMDIQVRIAPSSSSAAANEEIEIANGIITLRANQQNITIRRTATPHANRRRAAKKSDKRNKGKKKSKRTNRVTKSRSQRHSRTPRSNSRTDLRQPGRPQTRSMTRSSGIPLAKPLF